MPNTVQNTNTKAGGNKTDDHDDSTSTTSSSSSSSSSVAPREAGHGLEKEASNADQPVAKKTESAFNNKLKQLKQWTNQIWPVRQFQGLKFLSDIPKTRDNLKNFALQPSSSTSAHIDTHHVSIASSSNSSRYTADDPSNKARQILLQVEAEVTNNTVRKHGSPMRSKSMPTKALNNKKEVDSYGSNNSSFVGDSKKSEVM